MKKVKRLIVIIIGIYIGFGLVLMIFQRKTIYYPSDQSFNECSDLPGFNVVQNGSTRMYVHNSTSKWVVVYHGNAGSACDRSYYLSMFNPKEYSLVLVEYAGYSEDSDSPSEKKLLSNVSDTVDYVRRMDPKELIVVGESLGTAMASFHASIMQTDKLILISPFYSLADAAQYHYWMYPVSVMLFDKYPSYQWVRNVKNVLVIHGSKDEIIPIASSKKLFDSIETNNKTFVEIPGAGHNDIYDYGQMHVVIKSFLQ